MPCDMEGVFFSIGAAWIVAYVSYTGKGSWPDQREQACDFATLCS